MKKLNLLKKTLQHMEYYNFMAPFPVYDTGDVEDLKNYIKLMERSPSEYDNLPTAACKHCLDVGIIVDELENNICVRCGSVNEILIFKVWEDYENYRDEQNKINENY